VAGDHYGADAHAAHRLEPLPHALLHHVLEVDNAENPRLFAGLVADHLAHHQRGPARGGNSVDDTTEFAPNRAASSTHPFGDRAGRTFTQLAAVDVDTGH